MSTSVIPKWDDTQAVQDTPKWEDTTEYTNTLPPQVTKLESLSRGALEGVSFGFSDEATGALESLWDKMSSKEKTATFAELYTKHRDEARANNRIASEANPSLYTTGQIAGGIGGAVLTAGVAPELVGVGGAIKTGAAYGAIQGLGDSESNSIAGDIKNTAMGAGIGGVTGGVIKAATPYISRVASSVVNNAPEYVNKGASKLASLATGVDDQAFLRQIERPLETATAQSDDFAYKLGNQALDEIYGEGENIGRNVGETINNWLRLNKKTNIEGIGLEASGKIEDFLLRNAPSKKGFSSLNENQITELQDMAKVLGGKDMTGEDLIKVREYLDHIKKLNTKFDKEGTGPYANFLKQLRHTFDTHLDMIAPEIDSANQTFSDFKKNTKILGLRDERTQESVINNLYGKNKFAQQEAASKLLSKDVMDKTLDIEANKAISNAIGPSGSDFGSRRMVGHILAIPTLGTSELAVSPTAWKYALRGLGTVEKKIGLALEKSPNILGKYAPILQQANLRGAAALSSTHFLLQQSDPEYRQTLKQLEEE